MHQSSWLKSPLGTAAAAAAAVVSLLLFGEQESSSSSSSILSSSGQSSHWCHYVSMCKVLGIPGFWIFKYSVSQYKLTVLYLTLNSSTAMATALSWQADQMQHERQYPDMIREHERQRTPTHFYLGAKATRSTFWSLWNSGSG